VERVPEPSALALLAVAVAGHVWVRPLAAAGPMRLGELRVVSGVTEAAPILQRNVYGWFHRVRRGTYGLTVAGEQALNRFAQAIAVLDEPIATEAQFTRCATGRLIDRTVCPVAPHKRPARAVLASPPTTRLAAVSVAILSQSHVKFA
jgi:hypothetical protein